MESQPASKIDFLRKAMARLAGWRPSKKKLTTELSSKSLGCSASFFIIKELKNQVKKRPQGANPDLAALIFLGAKIKAAKDI